jgi:CBS domain-containing protein
MQAHEVMTGDPVTLTADTPAAEIARILLDHAISGVPVVDDRGTLVGMVSQGDLLGRGEADRETRRDWWLALLAEGEALHPDFVASLKNRRLTARDVMFERVPVLREDRPVGIVSRADLLRAFAAEHAERLGAAHGVRRTGVIGDIISSIDAHFGHKSEGPASRQPQQTSPDNAEAGLRVTEFGALEADFHHHNIEHQEEARCAAAQVRRRRIKGLIEQHIGDESWRSLLHHAREAAARGEMELMLLQFPADLCTDRRRAVNAPLPDWPKTLRGEAVLFALGARSATERLPSHAANAGLSWRVPGRCRAVPGLGLIATNPAGWI